MIYIGKTCLNFEINIQNTGKQFTFSLIISNQYRNTITLVYIHIYLRELFGVVLWEEINNILRLIIIPWLKVLQIIWIAAFWRAIVFNYNLYTDSNKG